MERRHTLKKTGRRALLVLTCLTLFSACFEYPPNHHFIETRTVLYKTNIIGITGPSAEQGEEYIEIRYSVADEAMPGHNNTESIMVSPPYIFQNSQVYMQYDFYEYRMADGTVISYKEILLHNYEEGGAEYLRIINHSSHKTAEFFFAGGQDLPDTLEEVETANFLKLSKTVSVPSVRYKKAPVQYLLFPNRKPDYDFIFVEVPFRFKGSSCGDLTVTEPWTVEAVNELYRAEYKRSAEIILFVDYEGGDKPKRMIDRFADKTFWGALKPGESLEGSDKIWLLATRVMFLDDYSYEQR